jgi:hypothetical protein
MTMGDDGPENMKTLRWPGGEASVTDGAGIAMFGTSGAVE